MKVITVSRTFPAYHPLKGEPTAFVQKIWQSLNAEGINYDFPEELKPEWENYLDWNFTPKHHTIRAGHRFKTGEMASLRVWSGKPYNSPQIEFAQVKVTCFDFGIDDGDLYIKIR